MGYKTPGTAAHQAVVKLETGTESVFCGIQPSAIALVATGFEYAAEYFLQQINLMGGQVIEISSSGYIRLYPSGQIAFVVIQIPWRLGKTYLDIDNVADGAVIYQ